MIYGFGGFWIGPMAFLAATLLPLTALLWATADALPEETRPIVHRVARVCSLGGFAALVVGLAGTAASLAAMMETARLVDDATARALMTDGFLRATLPVTSGAAVSALVVIPMQRVLMPPPRRLGASRELMAGQNR